MALPRANLDICVYALVALAAIGCGSNKGPIRGRVTFAGKPVESGSISFEPADGKGPTTGGKIEAGKYEVAGKAAALPGKKIVRIRAFRKTGRQIPAGPPAPPDAMVDEMIEYIPAEYNTRSTLTTEIVGGQVNERNFDLVASESRKEAQPRSESTVGGTAIRHPISQKKGDLRGHFCQSQSNPPSSRWSLRQDLVSAPFATRCRRRWRGVKSVSATEHCSVFPAEYVAGLELGDLIGSFSTFVTLH